MKLGFPTMARQVLSAGAMKRSHSLLLLSILIGICAAGAAEDAKRFAGNWEGRFQGTLYCTLKIGGDEPVGGTLAFGDIHTNDDGDLVEVSPINGEGASIANPKVKEGRLEFEWNGDGDGNTHLALEITGDGQALLHILDVPGGANIKPLKLERAQ